MEKTVRHLAEQLAGIRPDTLSVGFLETFRVPVRGNTLGLAKIAVIGRQGERIVVTPFDPASAWRDREGPDRCQAERVLR